LMTTTGEPTDLGYFLVCGGYVVHRRRVLLVLHKRFQKWVPPGGHLEPGETFSQAAIRETREETGLITRALSAAPVIHPRDENATPEPAPFYVDVELEGFAKPALSQYFFLGLGGSDPFGVEPQAAEVEAVGWFSFAELTGLETFAQVRSLAAFALRHHPDAAE